jgi:ribosomal protein S18 acetylase RimI-like enzyme
MKAQIRRAVADDAGAVCAIDPRVLDVLGRRPFIERAIAANECYVAVEGGAVVGYAVFDRSFFEQPFVSLLHVDESQRRRGVGAELIRHIESICTGEKLFTSTNESNTPMQHLCEKLGFVRSGRIENLDEGDPEIVYFKRLRAENRP